MEKINPEQLLPLHQPLLKLPIETLQKSLRQSRKLLDREMNYTSNNTPQNTGTSTVTNNTGNSIVNNTVVGPGTVAGTSASVDEDGDATMHDSAEILNTIQNNESLKISKMKRKLEELHTEDNETLKKLKARITFISDLYQLADSNTTDTDNTTTNTTDNNTRDNNSSTTDMKYQEWTQKRLHIIVLDFLLRNGFLQTSKNYANTLNLNSFIDYQLFNQISEIESSLEQKQCSKALGWCLENKNGLKRVGSHLEFELRSQEYIELVRGREYEKGILYMKRYFAPYLVTRMKDVQKLLGLLIFPPSTTIQPYRELYDHNRWTKLKGLFHHTFLEVCNHPTDPILYLSLYAGLSALKTHSCFPLPPSHNPNHSPNCPTCTPILGELSKLVPFINHMSSCVVCRVSGRVMDEDDWPMVMPNGSVYSRRVMEEMKGRMGGKVKDLRSGEVFDFGELRKAYLT